MSELAGNVLSTGAGLLLKTKFGRDVAESAAKQMVESGTEELKQRLESKWDSTRGLWLGAGFAALLVWMVAGFEHRAERKAAERMPIPPELPE